jgi:hypothetical protein
MYIFKGRQIIDIEVDDIDTRDYPDFCDAFIASAMWEDTGELLTDDELDAINEDKDLVWDAAHNTIYGRV